ncbi:MAG: leucyl/phenylalanyl-tRNA--protein transferase [Gallionellales bacterium RIFOXYB12_FULL_54_9]|nr:MAG: leucyl/phenylalanyl-tRNA--protein transferase [Gallionellales bacterium RIFOXYB12_FULL_54_9]
MIPWLTDNTPFPPLTEALHEPGGLLAAGGGLTPERLLSAYRQGIFPWFSPGEPVLWWSPDPRMVLIPAEFKLSNSLAKTMRNTRYEVRTNSAFERVMRACAAPRDKQRGTWIDEQMIAAYGELHRMGFAHSVEIWMEEKLAGGLYGVSIGQMFYGESMFSRVSNGSKIALAHLCIHGTPAMIDCQMYTPHLASLGARLMPRDEFVIRVKDLANTSPATNWQLDSATRHELSAKSR